MSIEFIAIVILAFMLLVLGFSLESIKDKIKEILDILEELKNE
jgi:uncharacterized protein YoxC